MGIFYLLSVFLLVGAFVNSKRQKPFMFFSFVVLFVLSGFRDSSVGTDTAAYEELFLHLSKGGTIIQEVGWRFLNKVVIYFDGEFQHVLMLSSLLTLIPIFYISKKYSLNPMLSIFLYFAFYIYLQSFNITRQTLAVSVIFMAYPFLLNRKPLFFILLVCLASAFHLTALICLPLIFVDKIPDKKLIYLALMAFSMIISVFLSDLIIRYLSRIIGYEHYLDIFGIEELAVGYYLVVLNAFFLFVLFTARNRGLLFKLFFIYVVLANLMVKVPFGYRLIYYFTVIQVLYLPYFVYNNKLKPRDVAFGIVVFYAYLVFYRSAGNGGIIPYDNILF